jgi:hypothetical protein
MILMNVRRCVGRQSRAFTQTKKGATVGIVAQGHMFDSRRTLLRITIRVRFSAYCFH